MGRPASNKDMIERLEKAALRSASRNVAVEGTAAPVVTSRDMLNLIADNQAVIVDALITLLERQKGY